MTSAIAVSAPGKVLLAGGYLVTDRNYTGLVFGIDARINVVAARISTCRGVQVAEIVVESPQFINGSWRYGYHLAASDGGVVVTQLQVGATIDTNPFIETTLAYVLTYISRASNHTPSHSIEPSHFTILADSGYYSQPDSLLTAARRQRFNLMGTTLKDAKKTGLGSSAALVTSLTAALLTHYLAPAKLFDINTANGKRTLHNLAQAAHCKAQGKIGSGFDVAAAVYGSCLYRRFSPSILESIPAPGESGFGKKLYELVSETGETKWDTDITKVAVSLPLGVVMRLCDVDCGTQTVSMVKAVNEWRRKDPQGSQRLWDELQRKNEVLAQALKVQDIGTGSHVKDAINNCRSLIRQMSQESGVPIEPPSQTELLDALSDLEGVYGGTVPGAGGHDAIALLTRDDDATADRISAFLKEWSATSGSRVNLLEVKGELEGARQERPGAQHFAGWI